MAIGPGLKSGRGVMGRDGRGRDLTPGIRLARVIRRVIRVVRRVVRVVLNVVRVVERVVLVIPMRCMFRMFGMPPRMPRVVGMLDLFELVTGIARAISRAVDIVALATRMPRIALHVLDLFELDTEDMEVAEVLVTVPWICPCALCVSNVRTSVMLIVVVTRLLVKSFVRQLSVSLKCRLCTFLTALNTMLDTADSLLSKLSLMLWSMIRCISWCSYDVAVTHLASTVNRK